MYISAIDILKKYIEYGERYIEKLNISRHEAEEVARLATRIYGKSVDETINIRFNLLKKILSEREAYLRVLDSLGLGDLWPMLEEDVEDLLLIPNRYIYITIRGKKYKTKVICKIDIIKNILKIARAKHIELTTAQPSFRFGLRIGAYRLRISVDLPPVVELPQAFIRIHRKKYTIFDLINSKFIEKEQINIIRNVLRSSRSLVISGPPGSGKTTLLAAIDDLIDPDLQRVYVDEADEFEDDLSKNQIKIRSVNKLKEIYTSLNRNIDIIIIGELQYPDHFDALRTALEMGFQALATMHARNVEQTLKRLSRYDIPVEQLAVVQLEKEERRRVAEIYVGGVPS